MDGRVEKLSVRHGVVLSFHSQPSAWLHCASLVSCDIIWWMNSSLCCRFSTLYAYLYHAFRIFLIKKRRFWRIHHQNFPCAWHVSLVQIYTFALIDSTEYSWVVELHVYIYIYRCLHADGCPLSESTFHGIHRSSNFWKFDMYPPKKHSSCLTPADVGFINTVFVPIAQ